MSYPYYIDQPALRALADSLGIELPVTREASAERRIGLSSPGVAADSSRRSAAQLEGHIHLNDLVEQLKRSAAYKDIADVLGFVPLVSDPEVLGAAINQIEYSPSEEEATRNLLGRLKAAYEDARMRTVAAAKREELKQVAEQNQLVILRGTFDTVSPSGGDTSVRLRLTHLEASGMAFSRAETPAETTGKTTEMPMPDEIGIEAVLPSTEALTDAGQERLGRGSPFYGRAIGHSASFDELSGVLTFSAYAVWGMPRPARLLRHAQPYEFLEDR